MTRRRLTLIGAAVLGAVLIGVAPPAWRWWNAPPAGYCPICLRHEHRESVVKVRVEGEGVTEACCLSCALTYGRQTSKAVTIASVTDHESGRALDPERAIFVVGSDVSPCTHEMNHVGPDREVASVRWDRCLPSVLAFPSRAAAEEFHGRHGGQVKALGELKREAGIPG